MMADESSNDGDGTLTINILSSLPEGEPQGSFVIKVSPMATGRDLLRLVCKEARVPVHPHYVLHTTEGALVPMNQQLLSISSIKEGKNLHWNTSENTQFAEGKCWNSYWFMAILSLLIGCVGLIAVVYIYKRTADNTQYGIVFDAGSSHTAMFIYKWDGGKINLTAVATQDGAKCKSDGEGISSYANNPDDAGPSLKKCLDSAMGRIPSDLHDSTPVYLGATAGMRLLQKENSTASDAVLDSVRDTISSYTFKFSDPKKQARILTGSEEGAFSWITSNYITGTFHVHPSTDFVVPDLFVRSLGALDLGGASTQISFIPNNTKTTHDEEYIVDMGLYGTNYSLYTHSFLCYGVNEAALRLQAVLVKAANFSTNVSNPCAPEGSALNVTHGSIFSSACAQSTFGNMISPPDDMDQDTVYNFYGESNATACRALVTEHLFNFSAHCNYTSCSFNGIYQPPLFGDYYAFSSYFYLMEFLNLTSSDRVQYAGFTNATSSLCAKNWTEVQAMKTEVKENLPWYCFQSIYIDAILVDGYKFDPSTTWNSIHFVESISGTDAGWSLGFILKESNLLPVTTVTKDLNTVTFSLLVVLFCAFIFITFFFVLWARRFQRSSRRTTSFQGNRYGAI
ncbi:ectonucleoside triphosphate diphosphohydrolase 8-like [Littorina saxatilis]|uniref:Uncharacterized protein n=1 Tax=Littorina saxatilis TaxID=31220 RepID=A0AAN9BPR6_9CAEN